MEKQLEWRKDGKWYAFTVEFEPVGDDLAFEPQPEPEIKAPQIRDLEVFNEDTNAWDPVNDPELEAEIKSTL